MREITHDRDPTLKGLTFLTQRKIGRAPVFYRRHYSGWLVVYPNTESPSAWDRSGYQEQFFQPSEGENPWNNARKFAHNFAKKWDQKIKKSLSEMKKAHNMTKHQQLVIREYIEISGTLPDDPAKQKRLLTRLT
jgi:hypothetical protein